MNNLPFQKTFDSHLNSFFKDAFKLVINEPDKVMFFWKILQNQRKASKIRNHWLQKKVEVPPVMIMSITKRCNLFCKGCYAFAQKSGHSYELAVERYRELFTEASELGISIIMLAGGEPLVRKEVFETAGKFKNVLFPFFTNATLINEEFTAMLSRFKNLIPLISIEGDQEQTDQRRGNGVYQSIMSKMSLLKKNNLFFGTSITLTRENIYTVTSNSFIKELQLKGCRLFTFVEYVPADGKSENLTLTPEQKAYFINRLKLLRSSQPSLFIGFPGDEEQYGGCLAAGRGFIHVNPEGRVEPCPFAPYSDKTLRDQSLRISLQSDLLKMLRENHHLLKETNGGCALWSNRAMVESLTAHI